MHGHVYTWNWQCCFWDNQADHAFTKVWQCWCGMITQTGLSMHVSDSGLTCRLMTSCPPDSLSPGAETSRTKPRGPCVEDGDLAVASSCQHSSCHGLYKGSCEHAQRVISDWTDSKMYTDILTFYERTLEVAAACASQLLTCKSPLSTNIPLQRMKAHLTSVELHSSGSGSDSAFMHVGTCLRLRFLS